MLFYSSTQAIAQYTNIFPFTYDVVFYRFAEVEFDLS